MSPKQLDEFQAWLQKQATEAHRDHVLSNDSPYFSGRGCAFNDAFEYLAILRMQSTESAGSAVDLLREVLEKDRAAIREMQSIAPWYQQPEELRDLHRRMEACLSPNATPSATEGGR